MTHRNHTTLRALAAFSMLVLANASSTLAANVYSNSFTGTTGQPSDWYTYANTSLALSNDKLLLTNTAIGGATAIAGAELNFGPVNLLSVGDTLTVQFDITQVLVAGSFNDAIRIGLVNSASTSLSANTPNAVNAAAFLSRTGYFAQLDTRTTGQSGTVVVRTDTALVNQFSSGGIAGYTNGNLSSLNVFDTSTDTFSWSITRTALGYDLAMAVNGGTPLTLIDSATPTTSFNTLLIGAKYGTNSFTIDNLTITTSSASSVPEPSTYAVLAGLGVLGFVVYRRRRAA